MSPLVEVDSLTFEKLNFAAGLTDVSPGDVIRQLTERLGKPESETDASGRAFEAAPNDDAAPEATDRVPIYKVFKGHRVEGEFSTRSHEVRILSEPWNGESFEAPTKAAVAVVDRYSPDRASSNTNGRTFWVLAKNGRTLRSVMGKR